METTTPSAPRHPRVPRLLRPALGGLLLLSLTGCVNFWNIRREHHEGSSVVQFLYPDKTPYIQPEIPTLRLPLRVGVAFIPSMHCLESGISEQEKVELLQKVAAQFKSLPFVQGIEIIPTTYLRPGGGFQNLDQLRSMLGIDVIALISYDQAQNTRDTEASLAYWSIVGAYVVPAQRNSTNTLMEAVVYDIASRSLLFRAPGTSSMINNSTLFRADHEMKKDAAQGIADASGQMTLNLAQELERFKVRIKEEPETVHIEHKPGFHLGGALDGGFGLILAGLLGAGLWRRSRR